MLKRYALEIYSPANSGDDIVYSVESDTPFLSIQKGDLVNPGAWGSGLSAQMQNGILMRVTGIEHFIIAGEEGFTQHKIGVFSEAVDNTSESRLQTNT